MRIRVMNVPVLTTIELELEVEPGGDAVTLQRAIEKAVRERAESGLSIQRDHSDEVGLDKACLDNGEWTFIYEEVR